ncbi:terminase large subunit domain-containing protein [Croceicoccus ponticola]|uniref:terminase large subunit domain-containing protein n=1 Tax=Croceicoccus ponticola TaxID=2217664 RepID=UPI0013E2BE78
MLSALSDLERKEFRYHWALWARKRQLAPAGDWRIWLICAGRGFGKTRAGSEWIRQVARSSSDARIALVGASFAETRAVMIEGESGILACSPPMFRPQYEPSLRRLTFPNGATATLYSAAEPEALRGPQHSHACRTGSKGVLCQRSARLDRCAAAPGRSWFD